MNTKQITEIFKSKGLKLTPQRIAVYKFLKENPIHPDALTVYEKMVESNPSFSKTTVYNCLQTLCDCGLLIPVKIDKDKIRFDADTSFHGHFKCTKCGDIYDFQCTESNVCGFKALKLFKKMYITAVFANAVKNKKFFI